MSESVTESMVCCYPFAHDLGVFQKGQLVSLDHPILKAHPQAFVHPWTPDDQRPTGWEGYEAEHEARELARREEAERIFRAACEANPRKLQLDDAVQARRDLYCTVDGRPTKLLRGSRLLASHPVVREHGDAFKPA
jgi:hypothetical protein